MAYAEERLGGREHYAGGAAHPRSAATARARTAFPRGPRGGAPPLSTPPSGARSSPPPPRLRPGRSAFERRREAASAMASLGCLLCLLVLLCGAANLGLSAHNAAKLRKPIIGKKERRASRAAAAGGACGSLPSGSRERAPFQGHRTTRLRRVPFCIVTRAEPRLLWIVLKYSSISRGIQVAMEEGGSIMKSLAIFFFVHS